MKKHSISIFRSFTVGIFSLIAVLGVLFVIITYFATTYYHDASTQLLNKDVAAHIAKFTSPFTSTGIDKTRADSVFQNAMVLSPSAEVYFLDTNGRVIDYYASEKDINSWDIELAPLREYIATKGERYIRSTDPKDLGHRKIFSAAEVRGENGSLGYIYVILGSKKSNGIIEILFGSHVLSLALKAIIIIIILSFLFSFLYLKRIQKNFDQVIDVLQKFENGEYDARFGPDQPVELKPVTHAFNKMADLISSAIRQLTTSEKERKAFIANISHDLRTPLSIARGYAELLIANQNNTGEINREYTNLIFNKIDQIEQMVGQLFELSMMDAVEFKPRKEPFVLSEIVQESIKTFQLIASEKKVTLHCRQCLYHVWINADISMMERVIQNLIENALKGTPEGGSIQAGMSVENNNLIFKIENEGIPLSADLLNWINQYMDIYPPDTRPQKAGLGLVIVQKILLLHGCSLGAYFEEGRNVFVFSLPVYVVPS